MPTPDSLLAEMATEIAAAYVRRNHVQPGDMPGLLTAVYDALADLGRPEQPAPVAAKPTPPVPIRKTVTEGHIISLEDGKPYKTLKRHLGKLGLTPEAYRLKWGLPQDYPMVSASYSAARSAMAKEMGLGAMRRKR